MTYPEPFDAAKFNPIAPFVRTTPKSDVSSEASLNTGITLSVRKPARVSSLWLVKNADGVPVSEAFNNQKKPDTAFDPTLHCSILHGTDPVSIAWKIYHPSGAQKLKFELFSASLKDTPIWTRELTGHKARKFSRNKDSAATGSHTGCVAFSTINIPTTTIGTDTDAFPDQWVTAEHGPYQLRLTVTPTDNSGDSVAWTYFDVVIASVTLDWGADALIPTTPRADITWPNATYPVTAATGRPIRDRETDIMAALRANAPSHATHDVDLIGNLFRKIDTGDADNFYFDRHKEYWGNGPRIPLVAVVKVLSAAGTAEDSPRSIGNTPFLWDWEDVPFVAGDYRDPATAAFLGTTFTRPAAAGTAPPGSINCHVDHGGKRGGAPVFPPQHDTEQPQAVAADFPFKVAACATRRWAAFSYARTTGAQAGKTGVLFQPSRMAGDKYIVRVMLAIPKAAMDCVTAQATLLGNHTNLPTDVSGTFRVFRVTDLIYMRKEATVPVMPLARTVAYWAEAGVKINVVNAAAIIPAAEYRQFLAQVIPNDGSGTARAAKLLDPTYVQSDGMHALTYYSFSHLRKKYLAEACQQYARQKGINKKLERAVIAYSQLNAGCHIWDAQLSWYNALGNKARTAIDGIRDVNWTTAGIPTTQPQYEFSLANPSKALMQKLAGQFMRNNVATAGIFFFHSFCQFALRDFDGTLTRNLAGNGGLAPYGENTLDKALFLVYMDPVDPGAPTMHPEDVTAHEIGHNMSLKHAKCYRDSTYDGTSPSADLHLVNEDCLMNYDRQAVKALCGFCVLRVRGWATLAGGATVALSNDANNNI